MSSQITDNEAIKMARELRDFCRGSDGCTGCPFEGDDPCLLTDHDYPEDWGLPGDDE